MFGTHSDMEKSRGRGGPMSVNGGGRGVWACTWLEASFCLSENAFMGHPLLAISFAAVDYNL
jgi:hypothetical protein